MESSQTNDDDDLYENLDIDMHNESPKHVLETSTSAQELNLFEDLIISKESEKITQKTNELKSKLEKAESELKMVKQKCEGLEEDNETLLRNISSLWKTAMAQLREKGQQLMALRIESEGIIFRRAMRQVSKDQLDRVVSRIAAYDKECFVEFMQSLWNKNRDEERHPGGSPRAFPRLKFKNDTTVREAVVGRKIDESNGEDALWIKRLIGSPRAKKSLQCPKDSRDVERRTTAPDSLGCERIMEQELGRNRDYRGKERRKDQKEMNRNNDLRNNENNMALREKIDSEKSCRLKNVAISEGMLNFHAVRENNDERRCSSRAFPNTISDDAVEEGSTKDQLLSKSPHFGSSNDDWCIKGRNMSFKHQSNLGMAASAEERLLRESVNDFVPLRKPNITSTKDLWSWKIPKKSRKSLPEERLNRRSEEEKENGRRFSEERVEAKRPSEDRRNEGKEEERVSEDRRKEREEEMRKEREEKRVSEDRRKEREEERRKEREEERRKEREEKRASEDRRKEKEEEKRVNEERRKEREEKRASEDRRREREEKRISEDRRKEREEENCVSVERGEKEEEKRGSQDRRKGREEQKRVSVERGAEIEEKRASEDRRKGRELKRLSGGGKERGEEKGLSEDKKKERGEEKRVSEDRMKGKRLSREKREETCVDEKLEGNVNKVHNSSLQDLHQVKINSDILPKLQHQSHDSSKEETPVTSHGKSHTPDQSRDRNSRAKSPNSRRPESESRSRDKDEHAPYTFEARYVGRHSTRTSSHENGRNRGRREEQRDWDRETSMLVEKLRERNVTRRSRHSFSRQPGQSIYKMRRMKMEREWWRQKKVDDRRKHGGATKFGARNRQGSRRNMNDWKSEREDESERLLKDFNTKNEKFLRESNRENKNERFRQDFNKEQKKSWNESNKENKNEKLTKEFNKESSHKKKRRKVEDREEGELSDEDDALSEEDTESSSNPAIVATSSTSPPTPMNPQTVHKETDSEVFLSDAHVPSESGQCPPSFKAPFNSCSGTSLQTRNCSEREAPNEDDTFERILVKYNISNPDSLVIHNEDSEMSLLQFISSKCSPEKNNVTFIAISPPPFVMPTYSPPHKTSEDNCRQPKSGESCSTTIPVQAESPPKDSGPENVDPPMMTENEEKNSDVNGKANLSAFTSNNQDHLSPVCTLAPKPKGALPTPTSHLPYSLLHFESLETPPKTLSTSSCSPIPVATPLNAPNNITASSTPPPLNSTLKSSTPVVAFNIDREPRFLRHALSPLVQKVVEERTKCNGGPKSIPVVESKKESVSVQMSNDANAPSEFSVKEKGDHIQSDQYSNEKSTSPNEVNEINPSEVPVPEHHLETEIVNNQTQINVEEKSESRTQTESIGRDNDEERASLKKKKKVPFFTLSRDVSRSDNSFSNNEHYEAFGFASSFYKTLDEFKEDWPSRNAKETHLQLPQHQSEEPRKDLSNSKSMASSGISHSTNSTNSSSNSSSSSTSSSSSSSSGSSSSSSNSSTCSTCGGVSQHSKLVPTSENISSPNENPLRTSFTNSIVKSPKSKRNSTTPEAKLKHSLCGSPKNVLQKLSNSVIKNLECSDLDVNQVLPNILNLSQNSSTNTKSPGKRTRVKIGTPKKRNTNARRIKPTPVFDKSPKSCSNLSTGKLSVSGGLDNVEECSRPFGALEREVDSVSPETVTRVSPQKEFVDDHATNEPNADHAPLLPSLQNSESVVPMLGCVDNVSNSESTLTRLFGVIESSTDEELPIEKVRESQNETAQVLPPVTTCLLKEKQNAESVSETHMSPSVRSPCMGKSTLHNFSHKSVDTGSKLASVSLSSSGAVNQSISSNLSTPANSPQSNSQSSQRSGRRRRIVKVLTPNSVIIEREQAPRKTLSRSSVSNIISVVHREKGDEEQEVTDHYQMTLEENKLKENRKRKRESHDSETMASCSPSLSTPESGPVKNTGQGEEVATFIPSKVFRKSIKRRNVTLSKTNSDSVKH